MDKRSRISLACDSRNAPIQFHWYQAEHGKTIGRYFTDVLIDSGVTNEHVLALMRAELAQRLRQYRDALLTEILDIKTIERNPSFELFEIRMNMSGIGQLRVYLIEPGHLGKVGVGLHLHLKDTSGSTAARVNRSQDLEIDVATKRCAQGKVTDWDLFDKT